MLLAFRLFLLGVTNSFVSIASIVFPVRVKLHLKLFGSQRSPIQQDPQYAESCQSKQKVTSQYVKTCQNNETWSMP